MGYSSYSTTSRSTFVASTAKKTQEQIFSSKMHPSMSPKDMTVRECRDSEAHPNSLPIIIGLDVTGSMGYIPEHIIKDSLSHIVENIIAAGIPDPAIMFIAIGDHISDNYPLQVAQFESGDEELAMWLQRTYLEGRGGGNDKESYLLAWHLAHNYVVTDQWDKRQQKGVLITIGDERTHKSLDPNSIYGKGQTVDHLQLLEQVSEKWDVFHIHANDGCYDVRSAHGKRVIDSWTTKLGQKAIVEMNHKDIGKTIARLVIDSVSGNVTTTKETVSPKEENTNPEVL